MCVSTLKILNRSTVRVPGLSSSFYDVPCGKCWQCQQARRDGWYIRNVFEYLQMQHHNGWCLFLTLTYNNENLPKVHGIPSFCKEDLQKYIKRFRMRLTRHLSTVLKAHNVPKYSDLSKSLVKSNIRYFVSCENGEKRHRPHYHILIYCLSDNINKYMARNIAINAWYKGFAVPSAENDGFVLDLRGIKYVSKYVGKSMTDDDYYYNCIDVFRNRKKSIDAEFTVLSKWLEYDNIKDDVLSKHKRLNSLSNQLHDIIVDLEKNRPFVLSSKQFGMFAFSDYCPKDYKLTRSLFEDGIVHLPASDNKTIDNKVLPQYFNRKLMYNTFVEKIDNGKYKVKYKLNDFGIDVKTKRFEKYFKHFDEKCSKLLGAFLYSEKQFLDDVKRLAPSLSTLDDVYSFLTKHIFKDDFKQYALLYSNYSDYLSDDSQYCNMLHEYRPLCVIDVYQFRQYVGSCSDVLQLDNDSIDNYYSYWVDILSNIHVLNQNQHFRVCLDILNLLLFYNNQVLTVDRYRDDITYQHNRWLNEMSN